MVILQRNHIAELFPQDKLGCRYAEPACQHTVGRAGSAAALVMARNGNADLLTGQLLQLVRNAVGDGRIGHRLAGSLEFLFAQLGLVLTYRALSHCNDRESFARLGTLFNRCGNLFCGVGDFRNNDDIRAGGNACVQRQPAGFMSHHLHDEHARVRKCGGMDGIDNRGRDINRGLKTECQLGAPQIVVDRLGQRYHVYTLHAQQVCGLVRAVAAQNDQTVKACLFHRVQHFIQLGLLAVLDGLAHFLERLARRTENGAADGQNIRKILEQHFAVIALDQTAVAVPNTIDGYFISQFVIQCFRYTAQCRVQTLTVAAAGQHTNL